MSSASSGGHTLLASLPFNPVTVDLPHSLGSEENGVLLCNLDELSKYVLSPCLTSEVPICLTFLFLSFSLFLFLSLSLSLYFFFSFFLSPSLNTQRYTEKQNHFIHFNYHKMAYILILKQGARSHPECEFHTANLIISPNHAILCHYLACLLVSLSLIRLLFFQLMTSKSDRDRL